MGIEVSDDSCILNVFSTHKRKMPCGYFLLEEGGSLTRLKELKKLPVLTKLRIYTHRIIKEVNNCWGDSRVRLSEAVQECRLGKSSPVLGWAFLRCSCL